MCFLQVGVLLLIRAGVREHVCESDDSSDEEQQND